MSKSYNQSCLTNAYRNRTGSYYIPSALYGDVLLDSVYPRSYHRYSIYSTAEQREMIMQTGALVPQKVVI